MNPRAQLTARFLLPANSFYDPSDGNNSNTSKHIQSVFLLFDLQQPNDKTLLVDNLGNNTRAKQTDEQSDSTPKMHVTGKRDKGVFRNVTTKEMASAVVAGLHQIGVGLGLEHECPIALSAKLINDETKNDTAAKSSNATILELYMSLNHRQPLSLCNCKCSALSGHSLGWISTSVKPSVAYAMCTLATRDNRALSDLGISVPAESSEQRKDCNLMVNTMLGEGTIEIEAQAKQLSRCFFISGDHSETAVREAASRLYSLRAVTGKRPLIDLVIWDAQRLPLRDGFADAILADLPFAGSSKKVHQVPSTNRVGETPSANTTTLEYKRCMAQAVRILAPYGQAVFVSADSKALSSSVGAFNGSWAELWSSKLNLGGLAAKICFLSRLGERWKDVSVNVSDPNLDLSHAICAIASSVCANYYISYDLLELKQSPEVVKTNLISKVSLKDSFYHETKNQTGHCYRIWYDQRVNNTNAKILEKLIRSAIEKSPPDGASAPI
jgi:hypothetical protein